MIQILEGTSAIFFAVIPVPLAVKILGMDQKIPRPWNLNIGLSLGIGTFLGPLGGGLTW